MRGGEARLAARLVGGRRNLPIPAKVFTRRAGDTVAPRCYLTAMFFDSEAWPPPPGGLDPPPKPAPRLSAAQERVVMRGIGLLLLGMFVGPLAGSSVVVPVIALVRTAIAHSQPAHGLATTPEPHGSR